MHKKIIQDASDSQIREFVTDFITMLKARDADLYDEAETWLYKEVYGPHFNKWLLECATKNMKNGDGTTGPHWSIEETNSVAKQYGVEFKHFNECDWNYAMNMIYSDFYGAVSNDVTAYYKLTRKFLEDIDAPKGKAFYYYRAMKNIE